MSQTSEPSGAMPADNALGLAFAANPLPMWVYDVETLAFLEVNGAAVTHYGYSRDEFLRMRITDIRPQNDTERLLADGRHARPVFQFSREWRHKLKHGDVIDVEIASHLLDFRGRQAVLVVAHDVTDHKRIEAAQRDNEEHLRRMNSELEDRVRQRTAELEAAVTRLQRSEARSRSLIQGAALGMYRADSDGRFLDANPALVEMLGYGSEDEVLALGATSAIYHDPSVRARLSEEAARTGRIEGIEVPWRRKDGSPLTVRLSARAVRDESGALDECEVIAEDVTDRRGLEDQLRQAQKMDAIGQLAGGIAHNFNNLMMAVLGYTELLLVRGGPNCPDREELEEIQKAGERATALTRQLLAFSRKQLPVPRNVDLNHTVAELRRMLARLIREDIRITCDLGAAPAVVRIDPHEIEQVVINLVLNSRDALPAGGEIHLEVACMTLDADQGHTALPPGDYVRLRVRDDGIGMSKEIRAHLFEPFFTTKEPGKGTGLGLASAYGIVRQAGGVIAVSSEEGAGTTVTIHFPALASSQARAVAPDTPRRAAGARGHELILLVEDEDAVRGVMSTALREHGYRVLEAARPSVASKMFEEHAAEIDLLLTDVIMPEMDGPAMAQCFVSVRPELQVLFISGYAQASAVDFDNPKVSFLSKPIQPSALANKVREILDRPRQLA